MKDETKNLKMGHSGAVCSEASTGEGLGSDIFARPPPLSSRWTETWLIGTKQGRNKEHGQENLW